jgi:hypothetical protein
VRHILDESRPYQFSDAEFEEMLRSGWIDRQSAELIDGAVLIRNGTGARHRRTWSRDEYVQMSEWGWFADCKVHLIGGEAIEMAASQYDPHAAGVTLTVDALRQAFGASYWVRTQASLDLDPHGVPGPDVAVVLGSPRWSYADRTILDPGEFASPLALPQTRVAVDDLLP